MNKNKIDFCKGTFSLVGLIFSMILIFNYIFNYSMGYFHSDCADSILWAQAAIDGKALVNPEFYYAAIMPLGGQAIMIPFVMIFGFTVKAQIASMVTFFFIFVFSLYFFMRAMKLSKNVSVNVVTAVLLIVSTSEKLREIFWGHIIYYSLGLMFLFVGMGLVLKLLDCSNAMNEMKTIIIATLLSIWTIICSVNGMQVLALYVVPVGGALFAVCFFDFKEKLISKKNFWSYIIIAMLLLSTVIGIALGKVICNGVESGYEKAYSTFSDKTDWVSNFLNFFPQLFTLLGVDTGGIVELFSKDGIINLIRIVVGVTIIVTPIIMVFFYKKFENKNYIIMFFVHHIMSGVIILGWTFGKLSAACWRLSPILVTGLILTVMFGKWIIENKVYQRCAFIVFAPLTIVLLLTCYDVISLPKENKKNEEFDKIIEVLSDNDLEYGYGTFWNANAITLLSDSKIKVRGITYEGMGFAKYLYQTNANWYENATGYDKYFVLLTANEYITFVSDEFAEQPEKTLDAEGYKILVYNHNIEFVN